MVSWLIARCRIGCQIAILGLIGVMGILAVSRLNPWGGNPIDCTPAGGGAAPPHRDPDKDG